MTNAYNKKGEYLQMPKKTFENSEVLTAEMVAQYLGLSRLKVYELFQKSPESGGIPNFKVGGSKRVRKSTFLEWIDRLEQQKVQA